MLPSKTSDAMLELQKSSLPKAIIPSEWSTKESFATIPALLMNNDVLLLAQL